MSSSIEQFRTEFSKEMMGLKTQEQRLHLLTSLFQCIVEPPEGTAPNPAIEGKELSPFSDWTYGKVAMRAYKLLFQSGNTPDQWSRENLMLMLDKGIEKMSQIRVNTDWLVLFLEDRNCLASSQAFSLLKGGVDLSDYELYRLAFQYRSDDTKHVVDRFLGRSRCPSEVNLCYLIIADLPDTVEILEQFRPHEVVFTSACLTHALKYQCKYQKQVVQFLLNQGVSPTREQWQFAKTHCSPEVQETVKGACSHAVLISQNELYTKPPSRKKENIRTVSKAIIQQGNETIDHLLHHIAKGTKFEERHLNTWMKYPGEQKLIILRLFLMNGKGLTENQWLQIIKTRDKDIPRIIMLHRMYGHSISDTVGSALLEMNSEEGASDGDPALKALEAEIPRVYKIKGKPNSVAKEFRKMPGLFDILIKSGIHPTLEHLGAFKRTPKDAFFELLLEDPYFEANRHNQELLDIAIKNASGEIVVKLLDRGFELTIEHVIKALKTQPADMTTFLIFKLKQGSSDKKKPFVEEAGEYSGMESVLIDQDSDSLGLLQQFLDKGFEPKKEHAELALKRPTIYTPELLQCLEKAGLGGY